MFHLTLGALLMPRVYALFGVGFRRFRHNCAGFPVARPSWQDACDPIANDKAIGHTLRAGVTDGRLKAEPCSKWIRTGL